MCLTSRHGDGMSASYCVRSATLRAIPLRISQGREQCFFAKGTPEGLPRSGALGRPTNQHEGPADRTTSGGPHRLAARGGAGRERRLLSTASLVLGVAAAHGSRSNVLIAGIAGLVAGAMSMAAGEYVSVHSQKDTEDADLALERRELRTDDKGEHRELAAIYVDRGLDPALARQVAEQLMAHDALGAHARDELGITATLKARPIQAALASAAVSRSGRRAADRGGIWSRAASSARLPSRRSRCMVLACSGSAGGAGGGRADGVPGRAGHLLGRAGDGRHSGRWRVVRHRRVRGTEARLRRNYEPFVEVSFGSNRSPKFDQCGLHPVGRSRLSNSTRGARPSIGAATVARGLVRIRVGQQRATTELSSLKDHASAAARWWRRRREAPKDWPNFRTRSESGPTSQRR